MPVTDTAPAADSPEIATELLEGGEPLTIEQFIAGVLRRALQTVEPLRETGEARTIVRVAHLFAEDLERADLPFDRLAYIEADMQDGRHA